MNGITTDQYTIVEPGCAITVEVHPVDETVEVVLGAQRYSGDSLRLTVTDADTCHRLAQTFTDARNKLTETVYERHPSLR